MLINEGLLTILYSISCMIWMKIFDAGAYPGIFLRETLIFRISFRHVHFWIYSQIMTIWVFKIIWILWSYEFKPSLMTSFCTNNLVPRAPNNPFIIKNIYSPTFYFKQFNFEKDDQKQQPEQQHFNIQNKFRTDLVAHYIFITHLIVKIFP